MQLRSGSSGLEPSDASGSGSNPFSNPRPATFLPPATPQLNFAAGPIFIGHSSMQEMKLQELKTKTPAELVSFAEELQVENASTMRKQELMFGILKQLSARETDIVGEGVVEVPPDGFGFLRSPEANYLPGPDDIYVSPSQIRRFGLRTGDTIDGHIRSPKEGERYFALLKVNTLNFEDPEQIKHKVHFDNLTPLYPTQWLDLEIDDPTIKDNTGRVNNLVGP